MQPAVERRTSSGHVLALVTPERRGSGPHPRPDPPPKRSRLGRWIKVIIGGLFATAALVVTGYVVHEQAQQKEVKKESNEAAKLARLDTPAGYRAALDILDRLAVDRPRDAKLAGRIAEIRAFLWTRFLRNDRARRQAEAARARAEGLGAPAELRLALRGYALLYEGKYAQAADLAETGLLTHRRATRLQYVLGVARFHLGDLTAAEATLQLAVSRDERFIPARVALARVQRQRGRRDHAERAIAEALGRSPKHLEARLEQVLLQLDRMAPVSGAALHRLVKRVEKFPSLLARAKLALARHAEQRGERAAARTIIEKATLLAADDLEIALFRLRSHSLPRGDVRKARAVQSRILARAREYGEASPLFAHVALSVGRPDEALRLLSRPLPRTVRSKARDLAVCTRIEAAFELAQPEVADRLCTKVLGPAASTTAGRRGDAGSRLGDAVKPPPRPGKAVWRACMLHAARERRLQVLDAELKRPGRESEKTLVVGLRHFVSNRYDMAAQSLAAAVRLVPNQPVALSLLAQALQKLGQPLTALHFLRQAVSRSGGSLRSRLDLARGLIKAGRANEAGRLLNAILSEGPRGARTLYDVALVAFRLERFEDAGKLARRLRKDHSTSGFGPYLSGLLHLQAKRYRRAREAFQAAAMLDPRHIESKLELARLSFWRGDRSRGRALFFDAWRSSRKAPEVLVELARTYFRYGRVRQAWKTYNWAAGGYLRAGASYRASEIISELAHQLSGLRRYYYREIEKMLRRALRISARPALSHLRLGQFLERRGIPREALRHYRHATTAGPELADGFYHLGAIYVSRRDYRRAEGPLKRFLELESRGRRAKNARGWLRRIERRRRYFRSKRRRRRR